MVWGRICISKKLIGADVYLLLVNAMPWLFTRVFLCVCLCASSNFGVKLVSSKDRHVSAAEVLKAGPCPPQKMETTIITLMHLALHSEKMELEVCIFSLKLMERLFRFTIVHKRH